MGATNPPSNFAAIVLTVAVILAILLDVRGDIRRMVSGRNVVLIAILMWYLLEAIQAPEALGVYSQGAYDFAVVCVGLAAGAFLVGYRSKGCGVFVRFASRVTVLEEPRVLWRLIVICSVIGFVPILYYSGAQFYELFRGIMGMRRTWGGLIGRGRYGGFRDAMLMLEMFVTAIGPFAVIHAADKRAPKAQRVLAGLIAVWPILRGYGGGTRSALITAALPAAAVFYWKAAPRLQRAMVIAVVAGLPLVYAWSAAMVESRGSGEFSWEAAQETGYVGHEMFRELLFIQDRVPDAVGYKLGFTYYVQLVNPIPRFLWAGKPTGDAGLLMAEMYGNVDSHGEAYLTVSPGLIGEMHMNFGVVGIVLLSLFGGWLVRGWDGLRLCYPDSLPVLIFYTAGLGVLVILGRSFTMGMFYGLIAFVIGVRMVAPKARPGSGVTVRPAPPTNPGTVHGTT